MQRAAGILFIFSVSLFSFISTAANTTADLTAPETGARMELAVRSIDVAPPKTRPIDVPPQKGLAPEWMEPTAVDRTVGEGADEAAAAADDITGSIDTHVDAVERASMEQICSTIQWAAEENELPVKFFVRLIWQESRFRIDARSRAGAMGIAQFMPVTAGWRGLTNPYDPIQSVLKSADYLRELRRQFGNVGLAAAAYNGGSGRLERWLKGRGALPRETRDYVRIITGAPVEQWRGPNQEIEIGGIPARVPCPQMAELVETVVPTPVPRPAPQQVTERQETKQVSTLRPPRKDASRSVKLADKQRPVKTIRILSAGKKPKLQLVREERTQKNVKIASRRITGKADSPKRTASARKRSV